MSNNAPLISVIILDVVEADTSVNEPVTDELTIANSACNVDCTADEDAAAPTPAAAVCANALSCAADADAVAPTPAAAVCANALVCAADADAVAPSPIPDMLVLNEPVSVFNSPAGYSNDEVVLFNSAN